MKRQALESMGVGTPIMVRSGDRDVEAHMVNNTAMKMDLTGGTSKMVHARHAILKPVDLFWRVHIPEYGKDTWVSGAAIRTTIAREEETHEDVWC